MITVGGDAGGTQMQPPGERHDWPGGDQVTLWIRTQE
jgi:hypothetical protein